MNLNGIFKLISIAELWKNKHMKWQLLLTSILKTFLKSGTVVRKYGRGIQEEII